VPPLPNFFLVGAARCGTTSLFDALSRHPDVFCCPVKETNHFARDIFDDPGMLRTASRERRLIEVGYRSVLAPPRFAVTPDSAAYLELFRGWAGQTAIGEASTSYLPSRVAAQEIARQVPDARIIIALRDPVERAHSDFLMRQQLGQRTDSFGESVRHELAMLDRGEAPATGLIFSGLYAEQVRRYLTHFPSQQVLVLLFEELTAQPRATLERVLRHLGVDPHADQGVELGWENRSRVARSGWLNRTLAYGGARSLLVRALPPAVRRRLRTLFYTARPPDPVLPVERALLREVFREDVIATAALVGRDLTHWTDATDSVMAHETG
jgi:hypothetical protein